MCMCISGTSSPYTLGRKRRRPSHAPHSTTLSGLPLKPVREDEGTKRALPRRMALWVVPRLDYLDCPCSSRGMGG